MTTTEPAPAQTRHETASDALVASVHESLTQAARALAATADAHQALAESLRDAQEQVPPRRRAPLARLWKRS